MLAALLDKWHLGPLRVINFLALVVLALRFGNVLKAALRYRFLEILGAASLPVFCVHLIVVLLALAAVGDQQASTSLWLDTTLVTVAFFAMYMTAWIFQPRQATKPTSRTGINPPSTHVWPDNALP
jgi:peptidoglycan/LPS O-acetylase OafA/YrhL